MKVFSTSKQLTELQNILTSFLLLPFCDGVIPGAVMESTLAYVRKGLVLNTYDFVDVIKKEEKIGWQVKSTKASTPVTWKRAKIPNAKFLIDASFKSASGLQCLGNAIIQFCNTHAEDSMKLYQLEAIGYSRLVVHESDARLIYFERLLCTKDDPLIFNPQDFVWHWSSPKKTKKKEQFPALHGIHKVTDRKWWAWHGLGENQLHFSGEGQWWPQDGRNSFTCPIPTDKMSLERLINLLCQGAS